MQQHVVVHVVQRVHVDAEGVGHAAHVQTERLEQLDEVHFLACVAINDYHHFVFGQTLDLERVGVFLSATAATRFRTES